MIKVVWLAEGVSLKVHERNLIMYVSLSCHWRTVCKIPQPMGIKGSVPKEMYQTLLTMKKLGTYQANLFSHLLEEIFLFQRKPVEPL
jgi:hypothetical protein